MAVTTEFKCPCCGGAIAFSSASQKLKCPYCDNEFDVDALKVYTESQGAKEESSPQWESYDNNSGSGDWLDDEKAHIVTWECHSCGGEIVGDENTAATSCPYCGSPVVMNDRLSGMLRPDMVIPFKLDKEQAKSALRTHLNGKLLLPKFYRSESHIDSITGIYVPFWLFDCDAGGSADYRATRVRSWSDSTYNYTETSYYLLKREGEACFKMVPVDGSTKMADEYMEAIEPFDYQAGVDFNTAYLAGYFADKYDVDADNSIPRANERIKNSLLSIFQDTVIGYASCVPEKINISVNSGKIQYALLPVWMLNTNYHGKTYSFAMNAQTGKLVGELPMSLRKFWLWAVGIFAGSTAIFLAILAMFGLL